MDEIEAGLMKEFFTN